jgi:hypothetical protein
MSRRSTIVRIALLTLLATAVAGQEKKPQAKPPHDPGGVAYPVPQPAAPPTPGGPPAGVMSGLARTQAYSASRISSYEKKGGPRDNVWVPATGEESVLADIAGPGAISHIWTTFRGTGRDLILRIYWEGSDHPSVEAPIGDFHGVAMGVDAPLESLPV